MRQNLMLGLLVTFAALVEVACLGSEAEDCRANDSSCRWIEKDDRCECASDRQVTDAGRER